MSERQSAREVIAKTLWREASDEYDYDPDDEAFKNEADAILAALEAADFTVARLEHVKSARVYLDRLRKSEVMRRVAEPLFRLAPTPQEHEPGESG